MRNKKIKIEILIFWPVQNDFCRFWKKWKCVTFVFFLFFLKFSENLQKSLKSDVSEPNGRRKHDFRVETMRNYTLKCDFWSTGTHFWCWVLLLVLGPPFIILLGFLIWKMSMLAAAFYNTAWFINHKRVLCTHWVLCPNFMIHMCSRH